MNEKPILFSGPMVRAILEGRKTQARRVIKPQPCWKDRRGLVAPSWSWDISPKCKLEAWKENEIGDQMAKYCPYGSPGDRLWVRETWAPTKGGMLVPTTDASYVCFSDGSQKYKSGDYYQESFEKKVMKWPNGWKWRPSIHMPRWASRILLEITEVRVERLQEISEEDAEAEGVIEDFRPALDRMGLASNYRVAYRQLWESINGKGSWGANPWVWVIGFRRVEWMR